MGLLFDRINLFLLIFFVLSSCKNNQVVEPVKLEGQAFGTTFHITYYDVNENSFSKSFDSLFYRINKSLSTYMPNSDISKINGGDTTVIVDDYFKEVFEKSLTIHRQTEGVFDPTIGILVNAWGFGPEKSLEELDSAKVNELLTLVGFDKVKLQNDKIIKINDHIYFDFNAIAKGYAVDLAGRFLESKNINNYLVEIGGELRSRGINEIKKKPWKIGIENPNFDGTRSIEKTVVLNNEAMATSGNYRKFKMDPITGKRYAHIINSKTGYPMQSNLLSVSVIGAIDCADVDAYATSIMAMSLENAKKFLENRKDLKAFIIYSDNNEGIKTFETSNF